uniref:Phosphatidylethanolamine binding protein 4 n=1 Tax=Athene cunicularia TaxID=194338 RepID=A0A663MDH0_ATHCN
MECTPLTIVLRLKVLGLISCCLWVAGDGRQDWASSSTRVPLALGVLNILHYWQLLGDVEIIYPELGDVGCTYIPKCHWYRRRISREWGSPRVRYPQADKKYVLVLVDPDAPSRANPRNRFWRHWLVTDIPVSSHSTGSIYWGPSSPGVSLRTGVPHSPPLPLSPGAWAMESFEKRFWLGSPVASTQFLTKHYEDYQGKLRLEGMTCSRPCREV